MASSNCKACENQNTLPQNQIASFASAGNLSGALTSSFGTAVDGGTASQLGSNLGGRSPSTLMGIIDTPGSNKQKQSMNDGQKKNHLINSVGLGNFSLNSTFERGLVSGIKAGRNAGKNELMKSSVGKSLIGATALGIGIPNAETIGIGSNDSSMFKLFKLVGYGLKLYCASLKGKNDYPSKTEEALGLILLIGINLDLLARLKSIWDKLKNFKFNFGAFEIGDLNIADGLFNLCDWVDNLEYGSDTIDSFRKTFSNVMTNKGLTEAVGKKLIGDGTYDTYAKNDFGFDQQFKSIMGDVDMLKCDACKLGQTNITLARGNEEIASVEFDPRTGLKRDRGYSEYEFSPNHTPNQNTRTGIKYDTTDDTIDYNEDDEVGNNVDSSVIKESPSSDSTETNVSSKDTTTISSEVQNANEKTNASLKDNTDNKTPKEDKKSVKEHLGVEDETDDIKKLPVSDNQEAKKMKSSTTEELETEVKASSPGTHDIIEEKQVGSDNDGVSYNSGGNKSIVYDTHQDSEGNIKEDKYEKNSDDDTFKKVDSKTKVKKPAGGGPAPDGADEVTSFHTGETITKDELKGTILEDADLNAVALLHPDDLQNLKNNPKVQAALSDASNAQQSTLGKEIERTIEMTLSSQSGGIIFGEQLPNTLNGNQIVINSERVLISAKSQECGIFSKRKFFVSTDNEITMNAKERIVLKTDTHFSVEAPTVHLGLYTTKNHPTLKGDCTVWWLQDLCAWLGGHTHSDPWVTTGKPREQGSLAELKAKAPTLLSERIFISG